MEQKFTIVLTILLSRFKINFINTFLLIAHAELPEIDVNFLNPFAVYIYLMNFGTLMLFILYLWAIIHIYSLINQQRINNLKGFLQPIIEYSIIFKMDSITFIIKSTYIFTLEILLHLFKSFLN